MSRGVGDDFTVRYGIHCNNFAQDSLNFCSVCVLHRSLHIVSTVTKSTSVSAGGITFQTA